MYWIKCKKGICMECRTYTEIDNRNIENPDIQGEGICEICWWL